MDTVSALEAPLATSVDALERLMLPSTPPAADVSWRRIAEQTGIRHQTLHRRARRPESTPETDMNNQMLLGGLAMPVVDNVGGQQLTAAADKVASRPLHER